MAHYHKILQKFQQHLKKKYTTDPISLCPVGSDYFKYYDEKGFMYLFAPATLAAYAATCNGPPRNPYTNLPMHVASVLRLTYWHCKQSGLNTAFHEWIHNGVRTILNCMTNDNSLLKEMKLVLLMAWIRSRPDCPLFKAGVQDINRLFLLRTKICCATTPWMGLVHNQFEEIINSFFLTASRIVWELYTAPMAQKDTTQT